MPGVVETTDTFAANQVITSTLMNNIIDQTTFTSTALANGTLALTAGQMKVATGGITSNELAADAVTANAIAADAVTTAKILDANVTTAKILDANVTTAKILDANVTPAKLSQPLTLATAQNSTSGTSIDFTSIPSWVKRITVMFNGVSTSGTSNLLVQIGDSGGIEATGYVGAGSVIGATGVISTSYTTGFGIKSAIATAFLSGAYTLVLVSSDTWVISGNVAEAISPANCITGGKKTLTGTLDRIRVTTVNGTDTFDAGTINIIYD